MPLFLARADKIEDPRYAVLIELSQEFLESACKDPLSESPRHVGYIRPLFVWWDRVAAWDDEVFDGVKNGEVALLDSMPDLNFQVQHIVPVFATAKELQLVSNELTVTLPMKLVSVARGE